MDVGIVSQKVWQNVNANITISKGKRLKSCWMKEMLATILVRVNLSRKFLSQNSGALGSVQVPLIITAEVTSVLYQYLFVHMSLYFQFYYQRMLHIHCQLMLLLSPGMIGLL